jgi:hypothetical protein
VFGWSAYQIRSDIAIRRHWQLACCAFSFCWWTNWRLLPASAEETSEQPEEDLRGSRAGKGEKQTPVSWPQALRAMRVWLEPWVMLWRYWRAFSDKPLATGAKSGCLSRCSRDADSTSVSPNNKLPL